MLADLGYSNVRYHVGDGTVGWPEPVAFERIIVTAGAPRRPNLLLGQLAPGGTMVAPVGPDHDQILMRYNREPDGRIRETSICRCVFVRLVGKDAWSG